MDTIHYEMKFSYTFPSGVILTQTCWEYLCSCILRDPRWETTNIGLFIIMNDQNLDIVRNPGNAYHETAQYIYKLLKG